MVRIGRRGAEPQGSDVGMWKYEGIWLVLSTRDLLFEGKFQQDSRHKEQAKSYMTVRKKVLLFLNSFIYPVTCFVCSWYGAGILGGWFGVVSLAAHIASCCD
jgi:hypothetical protein